MSTDTCGMDAIKSIEIADTFLVYYDIKIITISIQYIICQELTKVHNTLLREKWW